MNPPIPSAANNAPESARDDVADRHVAAGLRLFALITAYRSDGGASVGAAIVDELEVEISAVAARLHPVPPLIDADDIHQQVIMEILEGARSMKLSGRLGWVRRDLVLHATERVVRWLNAEAKAPAMSFELLDADLLPLPPRVVMDEIDTEADPDLEPPASSGGGDSSAVDVARRRAYNAARQRRLWARRRLRAQILEYNRHSTGGQPALNRRFGCRISAPEIPVK